MKIRLKIEFIFLLLFAVFCVSSPAQAANEAEFMGGSGTASDPFLISNLVHLNNVRNHSNAYFELVDDIMVPDDAEWETPLTLSGYFDGKNHSISNLSNPFFNQNYGVIKNLTLKDVHIERVDTYYAAAFARVNGGLIENCHVSGSISLEPSYTYYTGNYQFNSSGIGGIVSYNNGTIRSCSNACSLTMTTQKGNFKCAAGGIAGTNEGQILNCINTGSVSQNMQMIESRAWLFTGGITGLLESDSALISNCQNSGKISGSVIAEKATGSDIPPYYGAVFAYSGGIFGSSYLGPLQQITSTFKPTVTRCSNTGNVHSRAYSKPTSGTNEAYTGGIGGYSSGTVSECFVGYSVTLSSIRGYSGSGTISSIVGGVASLSLMIQDCYSCVGSYSVAEGTGYTKNRCYNLSEITSSTVFPEYDFVNTWIMLPGSPKHPQLRNNLEVEVTDIDLYTPPETAIQYSESCFISANGASVTLTFANGSSAVIPVDQSMLSDVDTDTYGIQYVHLHLLGFTSKETVAINVSEKSVYMIFVQSFPQEIYEVGTKNLDLTNATLYINYDNGTDEIIPITEDMISGFDSSTEGWIPITITYANKTTTHNICIYCLVSITVQAPTKTSYVLGQSLDLTGGYVYREDSITFEHDGMVIPMTDSEVSISYDITAVGTVPVTVTYREKTAVFDITVSERKATSLTLTQPSKLVYDLLEPLDFTDGSVTVTFDSSDVYTETLPLNETIVSGYDRTIPGIQTLTVSYAGMSTTYIVRVRAPFQNYNFSEENNQLKLKCTVNIAEAIQPIICAAAYRNEKMTDLSFGTWTDGTLTFTFFNATSQDQIVIFTLDKEYRPLIEKTKVI